ncbi:MAG TPA: hypothetical protein VML55_24045 [Planctomycetaceae bacterium]|nr:hypothetical protein [Planctomycetaceae bacterium]
MPTPRRPDDAESRPVRPAGPKRLVKHGLTLVLCGLILIILVRLAEFIVVRLALFESVESEAALGTIRFLAMAGIAANVLSIAGRACCLVVPEQSRARGFIYGAVALDLVSIALHAGFVAGALPEALQPLGGLVAVAALALFILFLLRLAVYLKLNEPASEAETLLGWGIWVVIALAALEFVLPLIPILGWVIGFFLAIAVNVLLVVMVVRYAGLLWWLRSSME